jgi:hypothetical protein
MAFQLASLEVPTAMSTLSSTPFPLQSKRGGAGTTSGAFWVPSDGEAPVADPGRAGKRVPAPSRREAHQSREMRREVMAAGS